jgi:hypothetical protein
VLCSSQDHLRTRTCDLDHPGLADTKNTNNWLTRKGDLQHVFPLYVPMVPSSALAVAADGKCLSCGGLSLNETICFGSLEFITDYLGGLSLSPRRDGLDNTIMGSTCSGPPSPLCAMIGKSTEEFHMASEGEGGLDLPSPRRNDIGASPCPRHNHIVAGEHSDNSGFDDNSTVASGAKVKH